MANDRRRELRASQLQELNKQVKVAGILSALGLTSKRSKHADVIRKQDENERLTASGSGVNSKPMGSIQ